jgi:CTP synthase (UTP-ammonia lyase)
MQDAYLSVVESLKHAGFHHGAKVEIDWIQAEEVEGLLAAGRLPTSTASSSPVASASVGSRARSPLRDTPASTTSRASGCASGCRR